MPPGVFVVVVGVVGGTYFGLCLAAPTPLATPNNLRLYIVFTSTSS